MHRIIVTAAAGSAALLLFLPAERGRASAASFRAPAAACAEDEVTRDTIYSDLEVDEQARPKRGNPDIPWPSESTDSSGMLLSARVRESTEGEVVLRFIVDYRGCPNLQSARVISATDSAFADVVRRTLPRWRFEPARKGGRKVSQVLQWKWVLYRRAGARVPGTE